MSDSCLKDHELCGYGMLSIGTARDQGLWPHSWSHDCSRRIIGDVNPVPLGARTITCCLTSDPLYIRVDALDRSSNLIMASA